VRVDDGMGEERNQTRTHINPRLLRSVQVALMVITAFLLIGHVLKWSSIQVDSITLTLVALLLVIPLIDLIRKIKVGDFEAEIGKSEVSKVQARAGIELPPPTEEEKDISEKQVKDLLRSDPRLAMAKIRIELEESLKRLYLASGGSQQDLRRTSLGRLVDVLVRRQVLSGPVANSVREVIALANRAVHGDRIEPSASKELAMLGVRLVREVQQVYLDSLLKPIEKNVITPQEVSQHQSAKYRVTTVVPYVENPTRNVYVFDQEALESFLDGYEEYAEFIVGVEQI
jgi:hypothetical protein